MNAGPDRPSGGPGGRGRRRRGRRPPNNRGQNRGRGQGGRDRENRHNKDGIYTAPMDHSYRAALDGQNGSRNAGKHMGLGRGSFSSKRSVCTKTSPSG